MLLDSDIRSLRESLFKEEMKRLLNDFKCNICGSLFTTNSAWKLHMTSHSTTFSCETCKKCFNNKANFYRHSKIHMNPPKQRTKNILHYCSICKKGLENKNAFYSHMKIEHETKTESCPDCAKSFYSKSELTSHRKTHTDYPRHLSCDQCGYKTDSKYYLKIHSDTHSETKYPCL